MHAIRSHSCFILFAHQTLSDKLLCIALQIRLCFSCSRSKQRAIPCSKTNDLRHVFFCNQSRAPCRFLCSIVQLYEKRTCLKLSWKDRTQPSIFIHTSSAEQFSGITVTTIWSACFLTNQYKFQNTIALNTLRRSSWLPVYRILRRLKRRTDTRCIFVRAN